MHLLFNALLEGYFVCAVGAHGPFVLLQLKRLQDDTGVYLFGSIVAGHLHFQGRELLHQYNKITTLLVLAVGPALQSYPLYYCAF